MKRKLIDGLVILICFILQTTFFKALSFASIAPNVILIYVVSMGFMQGKKEGLLVGFFSGLLIDVFYGDILGFYSLIYMYIGYLTGFCSKIYFDEDVKVPMLLVAGGDLLYSFYVYGIRFMLRGRINLGSYFQSVILPELVYTVLMTILLYRIFYAINHRLLEKEMKGKPSTWLRG